MFFGFLVFFFFVGIVAVGGDAAAAAAVFCAGKIDSNFNNAQMLLGISLALVESCVLLPQSMCCFMHTERGLELMILR